MPQPYSVLVPNSFWHGVSVSGSKFAWSAGRSNSFIRAWIARFCSDYENTWSNPGISCLHLDNRLGIVWFMGKHLVQTWNGHEWADIIRVTMSGESQSNWRGVASLLLIWKMLECPPQGHWRAQNQYRSNSFKFGVLVPRRRHLWTYEPMQYLAGCSSGELYPPVLGGLEPQVGKSPLWWQYRPWNNKARVPHVFLCFAALILVELRPLYQQDSEATWRKELVAWDLRIEPPHSKTPTSLITFQLTNHVLCASSFLGVHHR